MNPPGTGCHPNHTTSTAHQREGQPMFNTLCLWVGRLFVLLILTGFASGLLIGIKGWLVARREGYRPRTPEPDDTQEFPAYQDGFDVLTERFARRSDPSWWNDDEAVDAALKGIANASQNTPDIDSADYWPGAA